MTIRRSLRLATERFITGVNTFDADAVLALFAPDATIDDPSTGHTFESHHGIRDYVERYFVGYNTATSLHSLKQLTKDRALARVDFSGDFGHEIGRLVITLDPNGLITRIDADLE